MADYGYTIIKALVTNIEPDQRVKDAMNNINAARRNQEAATAQGEGDKTLASRRPKPSRNRCACTARASPRSARRLRWA